MNGRSKRAPLNVTKKSIRKLINDAINVDPAHKRLYLLTALSKNPVISVLSAHHAHPTPIVCM